uniref:Molybdopterin molybdenumtransferase n=1 Tax=uncultured Thiotrichaceae bacterium TaxID=298394 RepID=A0A6S6UP49_9GAMM|nr:MAG: Molybdopterin biosynthesis protein MoeA [uncultured Thiotrichaceae bacterium]
MGNTTTNGKPQLIAASCDVMPSGTLTVEQAQQRILEGLSTIKHTERASLHNALGRILFNDISAQFDVPPHRNSAMDGYAFSWHENLTDQPLQVVGSSFAGQPYLHPVHSGECVRIMTGAVVPEGCDTVEMQENCQRDNDQLMLNTPPTSGSHIRYPGDDMATGDQVLTAGRKLNAADLGLLASLGISEVDVIRKPRIAFCSTGDELTAIGQPLGVGDIYDSNRYTLYGMLKKLDVDIIDMGVVRDTPEAVEQAFSSASQQADVFITSGGVSVGDADYVTATLKKLGEVNFWKMAMKPGKPLAHGRLGDCLFFGLPGNPVSVMATFLLFVRPAILKLRGEHLPTLPEYTAISAQPLKKAAGRKEYQRGICKQDEQGAWQVSSTGIQESHMLRSMSQANCFIVLERETESIAAGETVKIIPFAGLL